LAATRVLPPKSSPNTFGSGTGNVVEKAEGEMMTKRKEERQADPHLKKILLEVVNNQLKANDPPETRETLERLVSEGISKEDAKIYIAQAVSVEVYHTLKNKKPFNPERYVRNLKRLPEEPED
jgi:hypothetical protein